MIVATITSGFGNQLFQYAAGYGLAKLRRARLCLDTSHYESNTHRSFELDRLCVTGQPLTYLDRLRIQLHETSLRRRSVRWPLKLMPIRKLRIVEDAVTGFDPSVLQQPDYTIMRGYWQNEEYFAFCKEEICKEFAFRAQPDERNRAMMERIIQQPAVCVHVRRGDYLNPSEVLTPAPLSYYENALAWMRQKVSAPRYFVFSDDPDCARNNLPIRDAIFVTHNTGLNDPEDLRLMSCCHHFIIANSTFSWWGAWLSSSPGKLVVAPRTWFSKPNANEAHIVPSHWVRL